MTREESRSITKKLIRNAKCGKEIAEAIKAHFSQFKPEPIKRAPDYADALEILNAPLFGLKGRYP